MGSDLVERYIIIGIIHLRIATLAIDEAVSYAVVAITAVRLGTSNSSGKSKSKSNIKVQILLLLQMLQ